MSAVACTLALPQVEAITESLLEQRESIVRIMSQANCALNGGETDWDIIQEALQIIAAANVLTQDTIDNHTADTAAGREATR